jgi:IS30 family transposase
LDVHSVTADSSGEFARLSTLVGASLYVRDNCQPKQRGSNENTILLFRQYQPKSEPSGLVTSRRIMRSSICQAIANVLAKASELPAEVRCRMRHCGRVSKQKSITSFQ